MESNNCFKNADERRAAFFSQLSVSLVTQKNYRSAINSRFMTDCLAAYRVDSLFEITDLEQLWKLYSYINLHPVNVNNHRGHSAAVMKYIRFLNDGKKYGKRIDYNKPRGHRTKGADPMCH